MAVRPSTGRASALHTRAIRLREAGKLPAARQACVEAADLFEKAAGRYSPDAAHARVEAGEIAELLGDVAEAAALMQTAARALGDQASAPDAPQDIRALYLRAQLGAGRLRQMSGDYPAAETMLQAAIRWARTHLDRRDGGIAAAMTSLGILRKAQ